MRVWSFAATVAAAAAVAFAGVGCAVDQNPPDGPQLASLDFNAFICGADGKGNSPARVLLSKCAMLTCHGQESKGFRLYGPGRLRQYEVISTYQHDYPLTLQEAQADFAMARGQTYGAPTVDDVPLVHKALDPSLGGGGHVGGVIFRTTDPGSDYDVLATWLGGQSTPNGCERLTNLNTMYNAPPPVAPGM